jgi:hypothetical protein
MTPGDALSKLAEIAAYQDDWDGEGTPAPTDDAIDLARDLLWGMDRQPDRILCSVNGAIVFEWVEPQGRFKYFDSRIPHRSSCCRCWMSL